MHVKYFSRNNSDLEVCPKSFSVSEFNPNKISEMTTASQCIFGYVTYKNFLSHVYQMIVNRLVRTAYLSELTASKKNSKNDSNELSDSVLKSKSITPNEIEQLIMPNSNISQLPSSMPSMISQTVEQLDTSVRQGVKSIHIHNLTQEIQRLQKWSSSSTNSDLDSIFPSIYILEEYEDRAVPDQSEYEDDFEEESKMNINTGRSEKPKRTLLSRRYYFKINQDKLTANTKLIGKY